MVVDLRVCLKTFVCSSAFTRFSWLAVPDRLKAELQTLANAPCHWRLAEKTVIFTREPLTIRPGDMSFLPIVGRELVVAARRPGTHRVRFWAALIVLGVWLLVFSASRYVASRGNGDAPAGGRAGCVRRVQPVAGLFRRRAAEEKREGTLGLLFLTDLRAYDVVLGKLVASSLDTFFGLLAIFPILGLTLLLGGVTGGSWAAGAGVRDHAVFFAGPGDVCLRGEPRCAAGSDTRHFAAADFYRNFPAPVGCGILVPGPSRAGLAADAQPGVCLCEGVRVPVPPRGRPGRLLARAGNGVWPGAGGNCGSRSHFTALVAADQLPNRPAGHGRKNGACSVPAPTPRSAPDC